MIDSTQVRINKLDQNNKSRKSTYPIAGSLIPMKASFSDLITVHSPEGVQSHVVRVKLTPDKQSSNGKYLITLRAKVFYNTALTNRLSRVFFITEPQSGDGTVVIRVSINTDYPESDYYLQISSSGVSSGTFQVI